MRPLRFPALLALCCAAAAVQAAESDRIGTFDFPSSAAGEEARRHFLLGVGYLHSFGMTQAQAAFRKAQELEPDFAMAYWGEAFTYQHPFFGAPSDGPGEALARLGPTPESRLAKAPTDREKGFLKAAEAYALAPGGMPARRIAWMEAMAELHARHPDDDEVKAFYAVSMLAAAGASGGMRERLNMRAGAMALELFRKNGDHPGAAHYVIHAFDDPVHAPIALEAARKYASIAPAVSHARHMPTHIFIQHGMWREVARWNDSAFQAARDLWRPGDRAGDMNHSSDWGQYGDLQLGDLERSRLWMRRAEKVLADNPGDARSINTLKTMRARHVIETQSWELSELSDGLSADQLLALGMSAAHLGEPELAERAAARLGELAEERPDADDLRIMRAEVAALAKSKRAGELLREGLTTDGLPQQEEALRLLAEAVAIDEAGRPPNGAARPLKPAHELAGEVHLAFGMPRKAAELFERSLLRMPNRPLSLLGAARAYAAMGDEDGAGRMYRRLLSFRSDEAHPAVREARRFVAAD